MEEAVEVRNQGPPEIPILVYGATDHRMTTSGVLDILSSRDSLDVHDVEKLHEKNMLDMMQGESLCSSVSSGVLAVLQQIEDWSTGEVPETVKAGKRKLQEGFTTVTKIKKPRTLDSTNENQRSKLELARRKVKPRPKAETTITTPTWSKRRRRLTASQD
ncbi:hypothetical protein FOXG_04335 [Fusarium oxysporum f. sp. lycopersici 4287]|uniref:Uncharacterized protein n=2 Tax=Fusarium oxysporum TaxID=5507 RepID=A0A0J9URV4_FUSO4|nr:hypothetical protein FOXG_04335 [Fusarium oxysporum f. sp. lycopersici 4287]KNB00976.1 hypothetical protein FOXG_04335 [Fusarium oxysporum f. sp. lycopersici 4287]